LLYTFIILAGVFYFSCTSSLSSNTKFLGAWENEDKETSEIAIGDLRISASQNYVIRVEKNGTNYLVQDVRGTSGIEGIYTLTEDYSLQSSNRMVTIIYDKKTHMLMTSRLGSPIQLWMRIKDE
jgi:hypothetical protein